MVVENLGTGATGAGVAHLPEIGVVAQAYDAVSGYTDLVGPDGGSFIVVFVDGDPEFVFGQLQCAGQEIPGVLDGIVFEVIAKAEVTQHLEEGMVTGGVADVFQVVVLAAGAHTALGGGGTGVSPGLGSQEQFLELHHAGIGEQQCRIITGNQRAAVHDLVTAFTEEIQKCLANVVTFHETCHYVIYPNLF